MKLHDAQLEDAHELAAIVSIPVFFPWTVTALQDYGCLLYYLCLYFSSVESNKDFQPNHISTQTHTHTSIISEKDR